MSQLPAFEHIRPASVDDALAALDGEDALPYHGGTELLAVMRLGLLRPATLVDLKALSALATIGEDDGQLVIGGGATHLQIGRDHLVAESAPALARVARHVGNLRVRASGTIGGNLVFAEPRSDMATMLLALEASVTLRSTRDHRTLPLDEFILGGYVTDLQPGELLTEVRLDRSAPKAAVYRKFQTAERPTVGVAVVVDADGSGRLAVGAVGDRPELFPFDAVDEIDAAGIAAQLDVVEDLSGAEDYKRHVTAVTIGRTLQDLSGSDAP